MIIFVWNCLLLANDHENIWMRTFVFVRENFVYNTWMRIFLPCRLWVAKKTYLPATCEGSFPVDNLFAQILINIKRSEKLTSLKLHLFETTTHWPAMTFTDQVQLNINFQGHVICMINCFYVCFKLNQNEYSSTRKQNNKFGLLEIFKILTITFLPQALPLQVVLFLRTLLHIAVAPWKIGILIATVWSSGTVKK